MGKCLLHKQARYWWY